MQDKSTPSNTKYLKPLVVTWATTPRNAIAPGSLPPVISAPLCFTAKSRSPRSAARSPPGAFRSARGLPHRPAGLPSALLGEDADRGVLRAAAHGFWHLVILHFGPGPCSLLVVLPLACSEALAAFQPGEEGAGRCKGTWGGLQAKGRSPVQAALPPPRGCQPHPGPDRIPHRV